jgi:hypothetical protein
MTLLSQNSAICWNIRKHPTVLLREMSHRCHTVDTTESDNPSGEPDNQQGRLEAYLSGFVDGEGTFSVGVTRRPDLEFGFRQPAAPVAWEFARQTPCSYLNSSKTQIRAWIWSRSEESDPLLRTKSTPVRQTEVLRDLPRHRHGHGGRAAPRTGWLREAGAYGLHHERRRQVPQMAFVGRDKRPEPSETARRTPDSGWGEDTVRAAWRHAESGRNDLTPHRQPSEE